MRFTLPDARTTEAIIDGVGTFTARYTTWVGAYEASDDVEIRVVDVEPSQVDVAVASPTRLWPPNHRLVDVDIVLNVVDACDPAPTVRLVEARINEGLSALQRAAGHADPDIEGFERSRIPAADHGSTASTPSSNAPPRARPDGMLCGWSPRTTRISPGSISRTTTSLRSVSAI